MSKLMSEEEHQVPSESLREGLLRRLNQILEREKQSIRLERDSRKYMIKYSDNGCFMDGMLSSKQFDEEISLFRTALEKAIDDRKLSALDYDYINERISEKEHEVSVRWKRHNMDIDKERYREHVERSSRIPDYTADELLRSAGLQTHCSKSLACRIWNFGKNMLGISSYERV